MENVESLIKILKHQHDNSYKFFLKEIPLNETVVEIMIYCQFVMLHLIHKKFPKELEKISLQLHGNLDNYIFSNNLKSKFPCEIEEFINSRYQHYQTDFEDLQDKKIMMPINAIRNIYCEPLIKAKASFEEIDLSEYFRKFISFSNGEKKLQEVLLLTAERIINL